MADHDTLAGITKVDFNVYEVTSVVDVGAGIDDVNLCVFIMKDGGLLRWTTGCATVYDMCHLIETATAFSLGADNYRNSSTDPQAPRFNGDSTCAPVFKGCRHVVSGSIARSDFDVGSDDFTGANAASPSFLFADNGAPCYINVLGFPFNHFASQNLICNGLVMDANRETCVEFNPVPAVLQNSVFIDNHPTSTTRHIVFWNPVVETVENLDCRNVGVLGSGIVNLIDPVGVISKPTDRSGGQINSIRSYDIACIDSKTKASIDAKITITAVSDNAVRYDENLVAGAFSGQLLQYFLLNADFTIYYDDSYRRALTLYGYRSAVNSVTVGTEKINEGVIYLDPDAGITEGDDTAVASYTETENPEKLYDAIKYLEISRADRHNVGEVYALSEGARIAFGANAVTFDSSAGGLPVLGVGTISVFTDGNSFAMTSKFNELASTGGFTFQQSGTLPDGVKITGDAVLGAVMNLTGVEISGNLEFTVAGTYIADSCSINTMTNTSGGSVILQASASTTIAVTPDPGENITIETAPVAISITALDQSTKLPVVGAAVYLEAGAAGSIPQGTTISTGLTNASGVYTDSISITSNQTIQNSSIRKASGSPNYTAFPLDGIISSESGLTLTALMINEDQ